MRIAIFCDSFFPESKAVAVRLYHLADALANIGGTKIFVHTSTVTNMHRDVPFVVKENFCAGPSNESALLVRLLSEIILGIEFFFRILFSRCNAIILSSPPFFASFLGVLAARLRKIPYVFDVRDEYPEVFFTAGLIKEKSIIGKMLLMIERSIYRNAFFVTTVTDGICTRINAKLKKESGKAVLVRNGYDDNIFIPSPYQKENFTVVFHGNLGKFQDPDLILAVAEMVGSKRPHIKFVIIGYGNNDKVLKEAKMNNIEFLGMVDYRDVPEKIASAHLGISFRSDDLISKNSFPVKLYEYIGLGIPVIITPISEAGEFFSKNHIGFQFNPKNVDLIANKIIELSDDPQKLKEMVRSIKEIRPLFSRQKISDEFSLHLIKNLKKKKNSTWKES